MPKQAYTLVEVLAVALLLGLLASLGVPPLLRAIGGDPLDQAGARLGQSFRDARAQSFGQGLWLDLAPWGFEVGSWRDGRPRSLDAVRLAEPIDALWTRDGSPVRRLVLDHRGHGPDTRLVLRQGGRRLAYRIDGLTGAWIREDR